MRGRKQDGSRGLAWIIMLVLAALLITSVPPLDVSSLEGSLPSKVPDLPSGPVHPQTDAAFIRNDGQLTDQDVLFYMPAPNGIVSFLEDEVLVTIFESAPEPIPGSVTRPSSADPSAMEEPLPTVDGGSRTRGCNLLFTFDGSNNVTPSAVGLVASNHSFFTGDDPSGWHCNVPSYRYVVFENLYDGIDLVYTTVGNCIKYEFVARPWSTPSEIRVHVKGHRGIAVGEGGMMQIDTPLGTVADGGLSVYYQDDRSERLMASFELLGEDVYGFSLDEPDPSRTLVIDPVIYSTYLAGSMEDYALDVACNEEMDIYLTGKTFSPMFPTAPGLFASSRGLDSAVFVTKLTAEGDSVIYTTQIRGGSVEEGRGIAVDSDGNAIVTGVTTSTDFPTTDGALQTTNGSYEDAFLFKLNPDGSKLMFSTYLRGRLLDEANDVAVDGHGNIYVVGRTRSQDFQITPGSFQTVLRERSTSAFLSKVSSNGSALMFSTFFGDGSEGNAITLDANGAPYVTGEGESVPITYGAYQPWFGGGSSDAFVTRFSVDGTRLELSTMIGGDSWEVGTGIMLDGMNNIYVTGFTGSSDFPTTEGVIQRHILTRFSDGFVCKLTEDGQNLGYGTLIGGEGSEYPMDIGVNDTGAVFITGWTDSDDFPVTDDAHQTSIGGMDDGFVCKLDHDARSLVLSTYVGGSEDDQAHGLAVTHSEIVYIVGYTASTDFPTTRGAFSEAGGGREDAFVLKVNFDTEPPTANAGDDIFIDQHMNVTFDGSGSEDNVRVARWSWTFEYDGEQVTLQGVRPHFLFHAPGTYIVTLTIWDDLDHMDNDTLAVTVRDSTPPVASAGPDQEVDQHTAVRLNATGSTDNIGIEQWTWTFEYDGDEVSLEGPEVTFTFDDAGAYAVVLRVTDRAGNSVTDEVIITVLDITPPFADAGDDLLVDQHDVVNFDPGRSSDNQGIAIWTWTFEYAGGEVVLQGPSPAFTFDDAGVYKVSLKVTDRTGLEGMDDVNVTVRDTTSPIALMGPDRSVSPHEVLELDASGSNDNVGIVRWSFQFMYRGSLVRLPGPRANFTFDLAGEFTILLNVTDAAGNWATIEVVVSVQDLTPPTAVAGPDRTVEIDEIVVLDGRLSTDDVGITQWDWSFVLDGETVTLDGPVVSFTFERPGEVEITLTVHDGAGNRASDAFIVNVLDGTPPVAYAGPDQNVELGTTVALNGTLSTDNVGIINWTWTIDTGDGVHKMYGPTQELILRSTGDHTVTLTVLDRAGNTASDTLVIHVSDPGEMDDEGDYVLVVIIMALVALLVLILLLRGRGTGLSWSEEPEAE